METEAIADEILAVLEQLLQVAGPEGTLEFLQVGLEEMTSGGQEQPPEMMSQGGSQAMPPMAQQRPRNALSGV